jgi:hypothetical protein
VPNSFDAFADQTNIGPVTLITGATPRSKTARYATAWFRSSRAGGRPVCREKERFEAVTRAAEQSGLLKEKGGRIGGRVSSASVRQAKRQTGIETDTDLIEFALATVALEDNFSAVFKKSRGTIDPKLKLGF